MNFICTWTGIEVADMLLWVFGGLGRLAHDVWGQVSCYSTGIPFLPSYLGRYVVCSTLAVSAPRAPPYKPYDSVSSPSFPQQATSVVGSLAALDALGAL